MKLKTMGFATVVATIFIVELVSAAPVVFRAAGSAADITNTVADFQTALGNPNNGNTPGQVAGGRRQINWDAGIVPFDMPGFFFNDTVPRGAVFIGAGGLGQFAVSNDGIDNKFDTFNALNTDEFTTFSAPRLFSPVGDNVMFVGFLVPGTDTFAEVNGFGAIFVDVDLPLITEIIFFDAQGNIVLTEFVDVADKGLSFLGVDFGTERIAAVALLLGNAILGDTDGGTIDVVVLDDLLYGEPTAVNQVPEPAMGALLLLGLAGLIQLRRRQEK